ncbi:MAG: phage portal protein [Robiginitomaculum sp.]
MMNWLSARLAPSLKPHVKNTAPEQVKSGSSSYMALHMGGKAAWTPRNYQTLAKEGYQRNAIVYRCIRMIAEAAASAPLCVMRGGECIAGDPAAKLLQNPHPHMSAPELFEAFYGYLQMSGNAYFEAALIDEVPSALYALRPDRMRVVPGRDGWPAAWEYEAGGHKRRYVRDAASGRAAIHHMRLFHPTNDSYGFSPLEAAAQAIDVHNEGGVWAKALLDNSARPSGALIYKNTDPSARLSDDQYSRLKAELEGSHSGARSAGRPLLLEGGLDWKPMSLSPQDMDFTTARREAAREIALAFGVPPMLLGIPGDNTYSNYKEANQAFWRQTIIPLTRKTARSLEGWLRPWFGEDLGIRVDLDDIPALAESQAKLWAKLGQASFLTDDEKRALAGVSAL